MVESGDSIVQEILRDREKGAVRLVSEYRERLYSAALALCRNETEAEDLVLKTFEQVIAKIESCRNEKAFYDWMYAILLNFYRKSIHGSMAKNTLPVGGWAEVDMIAGSADDAAAVEALDGDLVKRALESISPEMREVLMLHYFDDQPVRKIAKYLSISDGTVKSRLHYARIALARRLGVELKKPAVALVAAALVLAGIAAAIVANVHTGAANEGSWRADAVSVAEGGREAADTAAAGGEAPRPSSDVQRRGMQSQPVGRQMQLSLNSQTSEGETTMKTGMAAAAALTATIATTSSFSAALTEGASSREQAIALVARDRAHAEAGFDAFIARDRDIREQSIAKFRSDEPKGSILILR